MTSFLKSHDRLFRPSVVRPQENLTLEVPRENLDRYIKLIHKYVPLVPTELLFNIHESGFSDCEECKPKSVLIPLEGQTTAPHYPTSRKIVALQTLICCVTAAGDAHYPLLVSHDQLQESRFNTRAAMELTFKLKLVFHLMKLLRYSKSILTVH
jgi:hypothetical protein